MSLMSVQLWTVVGLARPLIIVFGCQAIAAVLFILFTPFPLISPDYQVAVLSAGFGLGATPTVVADFTSVSKFHGPSPRAFILPLVTAFSVIMTSAFEIRLAVGHRSDPQD